MCNKLPSLSENQTKNPNTSTTMEVQQEGFVYVVIKIDAFIVHFLAKSCTIPANTLQVLEELTMYDIP